MSIQKYLLKVTGGLFILLTLSSGDTVKMEEGRAEVKSINLEIAPENTTDTITNVSCNDTLKIETKTPCTRLTDSCYIKIAEYLNIEVAALKAVSEIECGRSLSGFVCDGKPIINFDRSLFTRSLKKKGKYNSKYLNTHSVIWSKSRNSGDEVNYMYRRMETARSINEKMALESTFWGMFQIGGFNWQRCGTSSVQEFVAKMSESEQSQLMLFANFIKNCGFVKHLQSHNWSAFARAYNGPSYAAKNYHIRLANAYAKYKKQENTSPD